MKGKIIKRFAIASFATLMAFSTWNLDRVFAQEVPAAPIPTETEPPMASPETITPPEVVEPAPENQEPGPEIQQAPVAVQSIVEWSWKDPDQIITNGKVLVPGASADHLLTKEILDTMLPKILVATIDGQSVEVPVTWDYANYPMDGAYEGTFTIQAVLPEGYCLEAGANPLNVTIEFERVDPNAVNDPKYLVNDTVSPYGTTINLFDYWTKERYSTMVDKNGNPLGDYSESSYYRDVYGIDLLKYGINANHNLKFTPGSGGINSWTGSARPYAGIVTPYLVNGYPQMAKAHGSESLAYLFDPSVPSEGKASYKNVKNLLQINKNGNFYFDSTRNFAEFDETTNAFKVFNEPGVKGNSTGVGQFFPFNKGTEVFKENADQTAIEHNGAHSTKFPINHYFGMAMTTRFIHRYDGYTNVNKNQRVQYHFSGDDDVWVYIDDVLVADLGGIHSKATLDIDFSRGTVTINKGTNLEQQKKLVDLYRESYKAQGKTQSEITALIGNRFTGSTYKNNTYHTLKFYYLERGNVDSNCELNFNLVTIPESEILKVDQFGNSVPGAEFSLYSSNSSYTTKGDLIAQGTTQEDGTFVLVNKNDGTILSLNELNCNYFILEETKVPKGYRKLKEPMHLELVHSQFQTSAGSFLVCRNTWQSGAHAAGKVTVTLPNEVFGYNNPTEEIENPVQNGTVFAVPMKYIKKSSSMADVENWHPVSGNAVDGWNVKDSHTMDAIIQAARENKNIFSLRSDGSYKVDISELPGNVENYYYMSNPNDLSNVKYSIAYLYTTSKDLQGATPNNTIRLNESQFAREFAAKLIVPNIANYLIIQKTDELGKPLTNGKVAKFDIYAQESIEKVNGEYQVIQGAQPLNGATPYVTKDLKKSNGDVVDLSSSITIPNVNVQNGMHRISGPILEIGKTYYLKEKEVPEGHLLNKKIIRVDVTDEGVYIDAGNKEDGVTVILGVGNVVKSLYQFVDGSSDSTLKDIFVKQQVADSKDQSGLIWQDAINDKKNPIQAYLTFDKNNSISEYKQILKETNGISYPKDFVNDVGYSRLQIQQYIDASKKENKQDLGNQSLEHLFSINNIVRVVNPRITELSIEKKVVGKNDAAASYSFHVTLKDKDGKALEGTYPTKLFKPDGTIEKGSIIINSKGPTVVTLKAGERISIQELLYGTKYVVEETTNDGCATSIVVDNDEKNKVQSHIVKGVLDEVKPDSPKEEKNDATVEDLVVVTNTYIKSNFEFTKEDRDKNPLPGATFRLYRLSCTDPAHDKEHQALIDVTKESSCWKLVGEVSSSNTTGKVQFKDLPANSEYRLVETHAPGGYVLPKGQWVFTIDENGAVIFGNSVGSTMAIVVDKQTNTYSIANYKPGELPLTGDQGKILFFLVGSSVMLLGLVMILWTYKRRLMS